MYGDKKVTANKHTLSSLMVELASELSKLKEQFWPLFLGGQATWLYHNPDSKVHGANMGLTWGPVGPRWAPCWPYEPCYQGRRIHSNRPSEHCEVTRHVASNVSHILDKKLEQNI